ncbi:hypothetical protein AB0M39_41980 [Streptomyces sp. NPDC051907]|uniref:hypothetical protein n=1 Tax=Streptomyces sp. NPDC051907 TaxID=3155284 RepID=UPI003418612C
MFTGRLRPALVRLLPSRARPEVRIHKSTALVPEGFIRQVGLTFLMPDPNKGGQNPPLRTVTVLMNPHDARIIAAQMLADAGEADHQNEQDGEGGRYTGEYADVMPDPDGLRWTNRVPKVGAWGRLYASVDSGPDDFTEGLVMEVTDTEVRISEGHTPPGEHAAVPRTDADLARFVTDDDNWETL